VEAATPPRTTLVRGEALSSKEASPRPTATIGTGPTRRRWADRTQATTRGSGRRIPRPPAAPPGGTRTIVEVSDGENLVVRRRL